MTAPRWASSPPTHSPTSDARRITSTDFLALKFQRGLSGAPFEGALGFLGMNRQLASTPSPGLPLTASFTASSANEGSEVASALELASMESMTFRTASSWGWGQGARSNQS